MRRAPEDLKLEQDRLLRELVQHAGRYVPFYRRHWKDAGFEASRFRRIDDLLAIPIVSAAEIRQAAEFLEARPGFVPGAPKALRETALFLEDANVQLSKRPRVVFGAGEYIDAETRRVVRKVFGSEPVGVYGQTEAGFTMWRRERREGFHVSASTHLIEIPRDGRPVEPGEIGSVVTTDLRARTMPVIRYDTKDLARAAAGACPCGRSFPVVASLEGRESGTISLPDGGAITTPQLVDHMATVLRIGEYRLSQKEPGRFRVEIKRGSATAPEEERVSGHLRQLLGDVAVEVHLVDAWPWGHLTKTHTVFRED